jgi:hypothetical protein
VISPDGCVQIRPVWRLFGRRTRPRMPVSGRGVTSGIRQLPVSPDVTIRGVSNSFEGIAGRLVRASAGFEAKPVMVQQGQRACPTPCTQWSVRQLVSHMTRGNLSYARLADGGTAAEFMRLRDADALGADPAGAFARSVRECAAAFSRPGPCSGSRTIRRAR